MRRLVVPQVDAVIDLALNSESTTAFENYFIGCCIAVIQSQWCAVNSCKSAIHHTQCLPSLILEAAV